MRRSMRRGFTLIEAMVIVVIIGIFSAAVGPNVVAFTKGQEENTFESRLSTLAALGKEKAISLAKPVDLQYDSSTNTFSLHTTDSNSNDETLSTVAAPTEMRAERFTLAGQESDAGDWKVNFYPDGSSDGGGVELQQSSLTISLMVDAETGRSNLLHDQLPDINSLTWTAGDYIHRASS